MQKKNKKFIQKKEYQEKNPFDREAVRFYTEISPRWDEMDSNGHINYMVYLSYFSEARLLALGADTLKELRDQNIGPFVFRTEVDYKKELIYPDTIRISTWVDELPGRTRAIIRQDIHSLASEDLICSSKFHVTFVDLNRRRPVVFPEAAMKQLFKERNP